MITLTKKLGGRVRIRHSSGDVLVLGVQLGREEGTVELGFWGSGGLIVAEEAPVKDVCWIIQPEPRDCDIGGEVA